MGSKSVQKKKSRGVSIFVSGLGCAFFPYFFFLSFLDFHSLVYIFRLYVHFFVFSTSFLVFVFARSVYLSLLFLSLSSNVSGLPVRRVCCTHRIQNAGMAVHGLPYFLLHCNVAQAMERSNSTATLTLFIMWSAVSRLSARIIEKRKLNGLALFSHAYFLQMCVHRKLPLKHNEPDQPGANFDHPGGCRRHHS